MTHDYTCFKCASPISLNASSKVGFRDSCTKCSTDLHCCKNCSFYDSKSYNECRETSAERVVDKDRNNRCDYFQLASAQARAKMKGDADATKKRLDDLFK